MIFLPIFHFPNEWCHPRPAEGFGTECVCYYLVWIHRMEMKHISTIRLLTMNLNDIVTLYFGVWYKHVQPIRLIEIFCWQTSPCCPLKIFNCIHSRSPLALLFRNPPIKPRIKSPYHYKLPILDGIIASCSTPKMSVAKIAQCLFLCDDGANYITPHNFAFCRRLALLLALMSHVILWIA